jgi:hypothetical protein
MTRVTTVPDIKTNNQYMSNKILGTEVDERVEKEWTAPRYAWTAFACARVGKQNAA